ncbi:GNAT family N-acetyltransferase [Maricurvus nonylphenolicus]|uniref:GNAT family N-acetyltransferase n=1 Tax=Maricurvus nonylphenolicus TaxID=1008307 RepID=UPI0036F295FC
MLKTNRLILRQWTKEDYPYLSDLCADEEVMEFFPALLSEDESFAMAERIHSLISERGWGFWAVEIPDQHKFIGFVGLHTPTDAMPFSPCVEIGWRLAKQHWGKGYATEAANAALEYAFTTLNLDEVVAFTTVTNTRSRSVMEKLGMHNSHQNFMHPDIESTHPLCEHVLYKIGKSEWVSQD